MVGESARGGPCWGAGGATVAERRATAGGRATPESGGRGLGEEASATGPGPARWAARKLFRGPRAQQVRSRGRAGGGSHGPRLAPKFRGASAGAAGTAGLCAMPTSFTVVPVGARADGGQDEAAELNEAAGPPEGGEPDSPRPGERGRTCRGTKRSRLRGAGRGWPGRKGRPGVGAAASPAQAAAAFLGAPAASTSHSTLVSPLRPLPLSRLHSSSPQSLLPKPSPEAQSPCVGRHRPGDWGSPLLLAPGPKPRRDWTHPALWWDGEAR